MVVVGASAGGLEALEVFLGAIPPDADVAIVIAQHLAPTHPSLIADLLSRATEVPVEEAEDGRALVRGCVLVIPPDCEAVLEDGLVRLTTGGEHTGPRPSIDALFNSAAEAYGEQAVGVLLSGTGSDGARGLRAIRGAGGLTMVQDPAEAAFDGMPRAAIAFGGAEVIADARSLGRQLGELSTSPPPSVDLAGAGAEALAAITGQLQRSTGIDFSGYKKSTLQRQIERRMALRRIRDAHAYAQVLAEEPEEVSALQHNLLVTVTSFFRDPEAFDALADAIADAWTGRETDDQIRIWVPGCATGEEVYSIAMLVGEALGYPADLDRRLKIYGTDLDETSLAIARRATYPRSAAERIPERLRPFYLKAAGDDIRMADVLRESVVFASHDVTVDPPFPRLDLVSCRNTLIYFTPELQQQVLSAFRFALRPGGLLFLGRAENLEAAAPGFRPVDPEHRLFARTTGTHIPKPGAPSQRQSAAQLPVHRRHVPAAPSTEAEDQVALLESLIRFTRSAFLVLDDEHRIIQVVGDVTPYCTMPQGPATTEVGAFLRPELRDEARALFLLSRADRSPAQGQPIAIEGVEGLVALTATPLAVSGRALTILSFTRSSAAPEMDVTAARPDSVNVELARLERELLATQDTLRRSLADLQVANEELEASSEELQASSEELQAMNEELQASNEELQASNEELQASNEELRARGEALEQLNTDLANIQQSVNQGMVIVDTDGLLLRFTPLAVRLFALVDSDVGQPLWEAPTTMPVPALRDAVQRVIAGGDRQTLQVGDASTSYLLQVLPYVGTTGERLGAIVTLTDVTELVRLRSVAEGALAELQDKSDLLQRQAAYDFTTGLLNRAYFGKALEHEIDRAGRSGTSIALAWVDLDRFKEVNDELGHAAGDSTLQSVGQQILDAVRSTDIVGRLGGDEFGVLIAGFESPQELDTILERIVAAVGESFTSGDRAARVHASVGVAVYPGNATEPDGLLRAADTAMYAVKEAGGNGFGYFDPSMNDAAVERREMRQAIDAAIEADAFTVYYQPIVSVTDGSVWGVEALLRWQREDRVVAAGEFVPFCESTGQLRVIGRRTLRQIQEHWRILEGSGHGSLRVCVNLAVGQLEDPQLLDAFDQWGTSDSLHGLVIEVVESVFLPDHHVALAQLESLAARGVMTSIDDFGAGYSNYRLLERLHPDIIKLDRSFLSDSHSIDARMALIGSAIAVGHVVGARIVAEGAETDGQVQDLREAGVDLIQGLVVAPPMPLPELLPWLAGRSEVS